ncbi:MAG: radical SAM protein [Lachnospiraceae bacterium]|nr:radical SAM protein [Lachnospiraceae bacterium]
MPELFRKTRSVCPFCLKNLPAALWRGEDGSVILEKTCPEHGNFRVPVWAGRMDFDAWIRGAEPLPEGAGPSCPGNCGICGEHESGTCCVLLEVTRRCDLRCRYCFADGGSAGSDPSEDEMKAAILDIVQKCGTPLLQFSGGEPTLRDDLPELVRFAKQAGCSYTQVNTNGIRLAEDPGYAKALAEAGLDIVFLQFDGTEDRVYEALRGRPLLRTKLAAVRSCADCGIGVTLVPTVVPGVNDHDLGGIVRLAASLAPGVRGVHFQPVSYFGRYPQAPSAADRYTLDMLMAGLSDQAQIPLESFLPSRCDHPLCGFHARFLIGDGGALTPLTSVTHAPGNKGTAKDNREYIAKNWSAPKPPALDEGASAKKGPASFGADLSSMDFDTFLSRMRRGSLTLSAMAFQDAMNLNIERLRRCSLHVYDGGKIKPFCARYLSRYGMP